MLFSSNFNVEIVFSVILLGLQQRCRASLIETLFQYIFKHTNSNFTFFCVGQKAELQLLFRFLSLGIFHEVYDYIFSVAPGPETVFAFEDTSLINPN